jgi:hypothetical protein
MKRQLFTGLAMLLLAAPVAAQQAQPHHSIQTPEDLAWQPGPGSLQPGAEFVIIEGDPSAEGLFTMRIRMPDGFIIAPHWHPNQERVTVLSGVFHLGSGRTLDRAATQRLPAGSHFSLPPRMEHFAIMEGETIIQLTSEGPWVINYIRAEDDPRMNDR